MNKNLSVYYDGEGDLLEIRIGKPTSSYFKDLGNDIFERIDEKTGEIRGFSILNFKKRTEKQASINIPLPSKMELVST